MATKRRTLRPAATPGVAPRAKMEPLSPRSQRALLVPMSQASAGAAQGRPRGAPSGRSDAGGLQGMLQALQMEDLERELSGSAAERPASANQHGEVGANAADMLQMFLGSPSEGEAPSVSAISSLLDEAGSPGPSYDSDEEGEVKVLVATGGLPPSSRDNLEDGEPVSDGFDSEDDAAAAPEKQDPGRPSVVQRYLGLVPTDDAHAASQGGEQESPESTATSPAQEDDSGDAAGEGGPLEESLLVSESLDSDEDDAFEHTSDDFGCDDDEMGLLDEEGPAEAVPGLLDVALEDGRKPLKFKGKAVRGARGGASAASAAAEPCGSFEDLKDALFDGTLGKPTPRRARLQPGGRSAKGRARLAPGGSATDVVDVDDLIVEKDSPVVLATMSPTSSDSDGGSQKISIDEYLERERRTAQAQQFAAVRVQRHIQERIYILRQRRRMQMGLLDAVSESEGEGSLEAARHFDEGSERGGDEDSAEDSATLSNATTPRSDHEDAWEDAVLPPLPPMSALGMSGWLLKRQRTAFRMSSQRGASQASKWDWRYFDLQGQELVWRKSDPVGAAQGQGAAVASPVPRSRSAGSSMRFRSSRSMGSLRSLASGSHTGRGEGAGSAQEEAAEKRAAAPGGGSSSPAPELLRMIAEQEKARSLAGVPGPPRAAWGSPSPTMGEDMSEMVDVGCNGRPAKPATTGRVSLLDVSGLVLVLPQGEYADLDAKQEWPTYHLQLFPTPESWHDGWTQACRPVLELWAPSYHDYCHWIRSLVGVAQLDPRSREVAERRRPAYLGSPDA